MTKNGVETDDRFDKMIELLSSEIGTQRVELPSYRIVKRDHGVKQEQEAYPGIMAEEETKKRMKRWSSASSPWPLTLRKGPGVNVRSNLMKQLKEREELARIDRSLGWLRSLVSLMSNSLVFGAKSVARELNRSLRKHK